MKWVLYWVTSGTAIPMFTAQAVQLRPPQGQSECTEAGSHASHPACHWSWPAPDWRQARSAVHRHTDGSAAAAAGPAPCCYLMGPQVPGLLPAQAGKGSSAGTLIWGWPWSRICHSLVPAASPQRRLQCTRKQPRWPCGAHARCACLAMGKVAQSLSPSAGAPTPQQGARGRHRPLSTLSAQRQGLAAVQNPRMLASGLRQGHRPLCCCSCCTRGEQAAARRPPLLMAAPLLQMRYPLHCRPKLGLLRCGHSPDVSWRSEAVMHLGGLLQAWLPSLWLLYAESDHLLGYCYCHSRMRPHQGLLCIWLGRAARMPLAFAQQSAAATAERQQRHPCLAAHCQQRCCCEAACLCACWVARMRTSPPEACLLSAAGGSCLL